MYKMKILPFLNKYRDIFKYCKKIAINDITWKIGKSIEKSSLTVFYIYFVVIYCFGY